MEQRCSVLKVSISIIIYRNFVYYQSRDCTRIVSRIIIIIIIPANIREYLRKVVAMRFIFTYNYNQLV